MKSHVNTFKLLNLQTIELPRALVLHPCTNDFASKEEKLNKMINQLLPVMRVEQCSLWM